MGLRRTVEKAVDTAFVSVGDLKSKVTLIRPVAVDFDFASLTAPVASQEITVDCIELKIDKSSDVSNNASKKLLLKSKGLPDITANTKARFGGVLYAILPKVESNGFVTKIVITREGV